jgi:hypothetical protein
MRLFHPTRRWLSKWAESGRGRWVDRHIQRCDRCSEALAEMTELDPAVLRQLQRTLAPTTEVRLRISAKVHEASLREETIALVGDLFGVGWSTVAALLEEDEDDR